MDHVPEELATASGRGVAGLGGSGASTAGSAEKEGVKRTMPSNNNSPPPHAPPPPPTPGILLLPLLLPASLFAEGVRGHARGRGEAPVLGPAADGGEVAAAEEPEKVEAAVAEVRLEGKGGSFGGKEQGERERRVGDGVGKKQSGRRNEWLGGARGKKVK